MRIAFFGDIVGRPGRKGVAIVLRRLRREQDIEFVIANAENAAGGKGIDPGTAEELQDAGIDVITTGNHVWQKREIVPYLQDNARVLRPLNLPPDAPGRGWVCRPARNGAPVAVVNVIGRVFMGPAECPFRSIDAAWPAIAAESRIVIVDMHAEATSEKVGMGRFLDGRASAVVGSHTHVQTADEGLLPGGTATLTDAGMCGPEESILGMRIDRVLERFQSALPVRLEVAVGPAIVQGALIEVDEGTGRATSIRRIRERVAA
jgi:metallophosphoesterase (TIGR00282 family)